MVSDSGSGAGVEDADAAGTAGGADLSVVVLVVVLLVWVRELRLVGCFGDGVLMMAGEVFVSGRVPADEYRRALGDEVVVTEDDADAEAAGLALEGVADEDWRRDELRYDGDVVVMELPYLSLR